MGITQTRTPIKVQKRNEACMKVNKLGTIQHSEMIAIKLVNR